jgi:hypothetical protein
MKYNIIGFWINDKRIIQKNDDSVREEKKVQKISGRGKAPL